MLISFLYVAFKMQDVFKKDNPDFDCEVFKLISVK